VQLYLESGTVCRRTSDSRTCHRAVLDSTFVRPAAAYSSCQEIQLDTHGRRAFAVLVRPPGTHSATIAWSRTQHRQVRSPIEEALASVVFGALSILEELCDNALYKLTLYTDSDSRWKRFNLLSGTKAQCELLPLRLDCALEILLLTYLFSFRQVCSYFPTCRYNYFVKCRCLKSNNRKQDDFFNNTFGYKKPTTGNNVFNVSVLNCRILQLLHQICNVFAMLLDDVFLKYYLDHPVYVLVVWMWRLLLSVICCRLHAALREQGPKDESGNATLGLYVVRMYRVAQKSKPLSRIVIKSY